MRSCQVVVRLYPSKRTDAEHHRDEGDRPRRPFGAREPGEGPAKPDAPIDHVERARAGRAGRTGRRTPRRCAPTSHGRTRPSRRARHRCRARSRRRARAGSTGRSTRARATTNAKSATAAGQRPSRSGYSASGRASPPPRSRIQTNASAIARQGESARQTFPRTTDSSGHPEPEDHVDPRRREVPERIRVPEERRGPDEAEERDAERPGRRSGAGRARRARPRRPARGLRRAPRAADAATERPSRTNEIDEDHDRAPVEEPRRDREVLDRPDPVCDEVHGLTVSTASTASGWWSSTSNLPGIVAVIGSRTGFPGVIVRSTS